MAEFNRLAPFTARHILMVAGALERDYSELSPNQVTRLLVYADQYCYPKPSNAAGSRGRYWHAYLLRRAAKAETHGQRRRAPMSREVTTDDSNNGSTPVA